MVVKGLDGEGWTGSINLLTPADNATVEVCFMFSQREGGCLIQFCVSVGSVVPGR